MSKFNFIPIVVLGYLVICSFAPDKRYVTSRVDAEVSFRDTIRRATFNEWTARWDRRSKSFMTNSKINYFNMPLDNMTQFMKENPGGMRYYIGLDSTAAGFTPHLILTATDANGNLKKGSQFHLYNVTTVCPPSCER